MYTNRQLHDINRFKQNLVFQNFIEPESKVLLREQNLTEF